MRLSATERIIREAEEAEAKATLDHNDDTKVSYIRSAEALQKLRSFDPPSPTAERERSPRSRESSPRLPAPPGMAGRRPPAGLPQGRPKPVAEPERPPAEVLTVELPFPVTDVPEAPVPQVELPAQAKGVGRRLGFGIAAATAATVVLVCGAWMAHTGKLGRMHVTIGSPAPSPSLVVVPPASGPLIHPIVDPAPVAVAPAPAPEPAQPEVPPAAANLAAEPSPETAAPQAAPPTIEPEPRAAPAKKSRPVHKAGGGKASKRKAHGAKASKGSRSGHGGRVARSAATPAAPARKPAKISDSPDDVLPMSSD